MEAVRHLYFGDDWRLVPCGDVRLADGVEELLAGLVNTGQRVHIYVDTV